MLSLFCVQVSDYTKARLRDPAHPFPFANLEWPAGTRKDHGLTGAREPSTRRVAGPVTTVRPERRTGKRPPARRRNTTGPEIASTLRSQPVTADDLD
jgi:hypothetical protein